FLARPARPLVCRLRPRPPRRRSRRTRRGRRCRCRRRRGRTAGRLPVHRAEPRAHRPQPGRPSRRARAPQRLQQAPRPRRGRGSARARASSRAADAGPAPRRVTARRARSRRRRRARLHGVGSGWLASRPGTARGVGGAPMSLDPASLQVLISRLTGIADEMGAVLRRSAFSANIKERADCSAALFTASGELLVQAEHIPVHLGSMPASVLAAIDAVAGEPDPGAEILLNDPFAGGTHVNDLTVVSPCFASGTLVGWVANRAHHADVGGTAPGSMPPDALDIDEEGLRLPPTLLTDATVAQVMASARTP